jgi:D-alanyl-D-alanine carboxypeptidase
LGWLSRVLGLHTNGMVMNDGSGLSRGNRFSARQCVALTRHMVAAFPVWDEGLPIGCVDGTIRRRFCGTDGANCPCQNWH